MNFGVFKEVGSNTVSSVSRVAKLFVAKVAKL